MPRAFLLLVCVVLALLAPSAASASLLRESARIESLTLQDADRTLPLASWSGHEAIASSPAQSSPDALVPRGAPPPFARRAAGPSTNKGEAAGEARWEGAHHYAFNALGALKLNAGLALDHRRPRLDGAGVADAAVPATLDAQPVTLDLGGQVTALRGLGLTWSKSGQLKALAPPVPSAPSTFTFDTFGRRVLTSSTVATIGGAAEFYYYEGVHRIAAVSNNGTFPKGRLDFTFLYDGVDHPLRLAHYPVTTSVTNQTSPRVAEITTHLTKATTFAYYELDLAGNVRRLRAPGGGDLGGYRYSAFGQTLDDSVQDLLPHPPGQIVVDLPKQPLRWKGMWRFEVAGTELYDARARMWSPALGSFLSVDEFDWHDPNTTLWGWPNQNPITFADPNGRGIAGALVGGAVGTALGFWGGAYAGAAATGAAFSWTGPGEVVAIPAGAIVGALGGGLVGGQLGSRFGSDLEDALKGILAAEHTKNARPSTEGKHEKGDARRNRDKGKEKGDKNRKYRRGNGKKKNQGSLMSVPDEDEDDDDDEPTSCE